MAFHVPDSLVGSGGLFVGGDVEIDAFDNTARITTVPDTVVISLLSLPEMAPGTVLANVTAGTAQPTEHPLATLAGAGLSYTNVTGVFDVTDTWADVLARNAISGANNPTISSGQKIIFAGAGASPAGGDIDAAGDLTLDSVGDMHLHAGGALHLGHTGTTDLVHVEADTQVDITSGGDISEVASTFISQQAGTDWTASAVSGDAQINASGVVRIVTGGVERLEVESTGAWQVGGVVGSSGQVLTSNGAGTPPTWEDPTGSGGGTSLPEGIGLTDTDHIIEVVISGGGVADWEASFVDMSSGTGTEGSTVTNNFSAATTTTVAAPGASTQRVIVHASLYCITGGVFTIQKDDGGTDIVLLGPITLAAAERIEFTGSMGWKIYFADGTEKFGPGPTGATGATGATGSTGATGATGTSGTGLDRQAVFEIYDDFHFSNITSYSAENTLHTGAGSWGVVASSNTITVTMLNGVADHPGIMRLQTINTVANQIARLYKAGIGWPAGSISNVILYEDISSWVWVVRLVSNTSVGMLLALTDGISTNNSVEFLFDTDTSASLQLNTRAATVQTQDLVTMPTANTWVRYELEVSPTQVVFKIDGVAVGTTHTTNLPTGVALTPYIRLQTRTTAIKQLDIDMMWGRSQSLSR